MTLSLWIPLEDENVGGGCDVFLKAVVVGLAGHGIFLRPMVDLEGGSGHHTWWLILKLLWPILVHPGKFGVFHFCHLAGEWGDCWAPSFRPNFGAHLES